MKMVSVFSANGDEIRVTSDSLDYYSSIGWNQVVAKEATEVAAKVNEVIEEDSEEFE